MRDVATFLKMSVIALTVAIPVAAGGEECAPETDATGAMIADLRTLGLADSKGQAQFFAQARQSAQTFPSSRDGEIVALDPSSYDAAGGQLFVVGSPREGRVEVRDGLQRTSTQWIPTSILGSDAYNGSFGASLALGDLNADGNPDLVVGEPLWTREEWFNGVRTGLSGAVGRVHVFYGDAQGRFKEKADMIVEGKSKYDRFGTSVAAGDWDGDGRDDLVVYGSGFSGVFFKDDPKGQLGVYRGGSEGLAKDPDFWFESREILGGKITFFTTAGRGFDGAVAVNGPGWPKELDVTVNGLQPSYDE